jgi:speckle-type POZ protein
MATEVDMTPPPCRKTEVCNAFLAMLDAGKGDVTLKVGNPPERIEAHANVLGARSPVFEVMFTNGMRESETKEAVFEDLDPRAVREMVRYMYGGEVPEGSLSKDEHTIALLTAANRFDVQSLMDCCTRALRERFSVEKIAEYLKIADMMSCDAFKKSCLEYIADHAVEVEETEAYNNLVEERPTLLRDVVAQLSGSVHKRRRVEKAGAP